MNCPRCGALIYSHLEEQVRVLKEENNNLRKQLGEARRELWQPTPIEPPYTAKEKSALKKFWEKIGLKLTNKE